MKRRTLVICLILLIVLLNGCKSTEAVNINDTEPKLQLETEHFEFYCVDSDKKCLKDLSKEIENNYERLTSDLKTSIEYKPKVYIYPNLKSFHEAINQPNAQDWLVGTAWNKDIKMVSPLNPGKSHDYQSIKKVLLHEFVHVLQMNIADNPNSIPIWLLEGTAMFETKQVDKNTLSFLKREAIAGKAPSLDELNENFYNGNNYAYPYSYTIVDFIVNEYGYDKLIEITKDNSSIEKILGVSTEEFEKLWMQYIKQNYI